MANSTIEINSSLKNAVLSSSDHILITHEAGGLESAKMLVMSVLENKLNSVPTVGLTDKKTISIDQTRELIEIAKLKVVDDVSYLVIQEADKMTVEAQTSLLKTLEESHQRARFLIFTSEPNLLLPTVLSRLTIIDLKNFNQDTNSTINPKLLRATGYSQKAAENFMLNSDDSAEYAKKWLSLSSVQRFDVLLKIKDQQLAEKFLLNLKILLYGILLDKTQNLNSATYERYIKQLILLDKISTQIKNNANLKLNLTQLVVSF